MRTLFSCGTRAAVAVVAFVCAAGSVQAETTLRVLETWPAGESVTLGRNQNYYLRIGYATDEPVRIWARPYYQGREVSAGSNPSPVFSGSGDALGWFFFMENDQRVDEIRITAGDGSPSGERVTVSHAVRIRPGDAPAADTVQPAWLVELLAETERLQREAYEQRMNTPVSGGDSLLFLGFMLAVLALGIGGFAAPLWAMRRWHGAWRIAAAVPLVILGFVALRIVLDTARDPTSHNLWPFEILQAGFLSLAIVAVLLVARKLLGTPEIQ